MFIGCAATSVAQRDDRYLQHDVEGSPNTTTPPIVSATVDSSISDKVCPTPALFDGEWQDMATFHGPAQLGQRVRIAGRIDGNADERSISSFCSSTNVRILAVFQERRCAPIGDLLVVEATVAEMSLIEHVTNHLAPYALRDAVVVGRVDATSEFCSVEGRGRHSRPVIVSNSTNR